MTQSIHKKILLATGALLILFTIFMIQRTQSASNDTAIVPAAVPVATEQTITDESSPIDDEASEAEEEVAPAAPVSTEPAPVQSTPAAEVIPEVVEDEGAPEGYVGFPPRCETLWWESLPSENPIRFTAELNPFQTNVEIESYDFYVNDVLIQSTASNAFSYTATTTGSLTFHVIIQTNLGDTLRSTLCEQTLIIDSSYLN